jgi:hypothetical protein
MLLPDNVHPDQTIYFNASFVISVLIDLGAAELLDLYEKVRDRRSISFSTFHLCLDWLFLIDVIASDDGTMVTLCT